MKKLLVIVALWVAIGAGIGLGTVSYQLPNDKRAAVDVVGFDGGSGGLRGGGRAFLSFVYSSHSSFNGASRIDEGPIDQPDAYSRDKHSSKSCPKHTFCPQSHVLLGLQVSYFAVLLPLTCYLIFLGYKIADCGFDALDTGQKIRGALLFWSGMLLACAAALVLPWSGYWMVFEGGIDSLLS